LQNKWCRLNLGRMGVNCVKDSNENNIIDSDSAGIDKDVKTAK